MRTPTPFEMAQALRLAADLAEVFIAGDETKIDELFDAADKEVLVRIVVGLLAALSGEMMLHNHPLNEIWETFREQANEYTAGLN